MTTTRTRFERVALLLCFALTGGTVDAHAQGSTVDQATAQDALVNLGSLWMKATGGQALSTDFVSNYLPAEATPEATAVVTEPAPGWDDLILQPTMTAASAGSLRLPIKSMAPGDARDVYRRQAYLSLYVRKHDAVRQVWLSGRVPSDQRMSPEELAQHGRHAAAAQVELFLIERIALGEGETQEQKCAAYQRATLHARALGLEAGAGTGTNAGARPITDADLPSGWQELYRAARAHHASQHAPFARALGLLCAEGAQVTPTQTRDHLELALTKRLEKNITAFFGRRRESLITVQEAFVGLANENDTFVPRKAIADLYKQVVDAQSVYQIVYNDTFGLQTRLDKLTAATKRLTERLAANPAHSAFPDETRALAKLRGELTAFLTLAKSISAIRFPSSADQQSLAPCAQLPDSFEMRAPGTDLAPRVDACIAAAAALREKLFRAPDVPPERALFLQHLRSLSHAFLTANAW